MVDKHKSKLDTATKFESDIMNHVTPNWRKVDKVFAWGVVPYCETSHEGMKKVFYTLGHKFQLFDVDNDGRYCYPQPSTDKQRIHLCVDALSARNFWCLYANLTMKLTEIGTSDFVLPLIESLNRFTCTHDYLQETLFHRNESHILISLRWSATTLIMPS